MAKRTTFTTDDDDYFYLEREAGRRGVPMAHIIREAVAEYVADIRAANRPSIGYLDGDPDLAQRSADDEDAPFRDAVRQSLGGLGDDEGSWR